MGLPAGVWGVVFFMTMCLNEGQGHRGPNRPNDIIFLCFRIKYKTTLYFLIYRLTRCRPTEWGYPSRNGQGLLLPARGSRTDMQAESFPQWCAQEVLGKCWLSEWVELPGSPLV